MAEDFQYPQVNAPPPEESFGDLTGVETQIPNPDLLYGPIEVGPWPDNPISDFSPIGLYLNDPAFIFSEESSSSSSSSSPPSSSSSSKSTAIVPCSWNETGYAALFIAEMPEVRFDDHVEIFPTKRLSETPLDEKFLEVCEPDTVRVISAIGDSGGVKYARVEGQEIILSLPLFMRPKRVCVRLSGIRKGFRNLRFPDRTENQFIHNEKFINSAYPDE